ncbi:hypothetical protein AMECASPLE_027921 [Ameca splendens]|uniref:Uncharacterized protein n=1 Tax=Ameca splendens TaxID=208324 RepID=A0ABV1ACQ7_9TELE
MPVRLHLGVQYLTNHTRMFPPTTDLAEEHQARSMDLFTFLSQEAEKSLRRSAGLSVPQSAYDGSRLVSPVPGTGPLQSTAVEQPTSGLQSAAAEQPDSRPDTPQHDTP